MSAEVSISAAVRPPLAIFSTSAPARRRRFFGLAGSHWPHMAPMRGTPPDEPQPRMVKRRVIRQPSLSHQPAEAPW